MDACFKSSLLPCWSAGSICRQDGLRWLLGGAGDLQRQGGVRLVCRPTSCSLSTSHATFQFGSLPDRCAIATVGARCFGIPGEPSSPRASPICMAEEKVGAGVAKLWRRKPKEKDLEQIGWERLMRAITDGSARGPGNAAKVLERRHQQKPLERKAIVGALRRYMQLKRWAVVVELLEWLEAQDWWEFTKHDCSMLVTALSCLGEADAAEAVVIRWSMMGGKPNVVILTNLLRAYATATRVSEAEALLKQMEVNGPKPTLITYQVMLVAYSKTNRLEDAERLLAKLEERELFVDVQVYNSMMSAYVQKNRQEDALRIFRLIKAHGSLEPTLATYNIMMNMFARQARTHEAEGVLRQLQAAGLRPSTSTYTSLLCAYGRAGRADQAQAVFEDMVACKIRPSCVSYTALIDAYGRIGDLEKAETVLKEMERFNIKPNAVTYTALVDAYASKGQLEVARAWLATMQRQGVEPNSYTYCVLLNGYRLAGDFQGAVDVHAEMLRAGVLPSQATWGSLISTYADAGDFDGAMESFKGMIASGLVPGEGVKRLLMGACQCEEHRQELLSMLGEEFVKFNAWGMKKAFGEDMKVEIDVLESGDDDDLLINDIEEFKVLL